MRIIPSLLTTINRSTNHQRHRERKIIYRFRIINLSKLIQTIVSADKLGRRKYSPGTSLQVEIYCQKRESSTAMPILAINTVLLVSLAKYGITDSKALFANVSRIVLCLLREVFNTGKLFSKPLSKPFFKRYWQTILLNTIVTKKKTCIEK